MKDKNQVGSRDKKKVLQISIGIVAGLGIVVAIILAFLLNYNVSSPNQVEILKDVKTYFSVNANNNYKGYRFVFEGDGDKVIVDSPKNIIILDEDIKSQDLKVGVKYSVYACYLGETEGANSDYSKPVSWTYYYQLSAPVISYEEKTNIISWPEVEYAKKYVIHIIDKSNLSKELPIEQTQTSFDLNLIDGGEKEIYVYAFSDNEYVEQSKVSNILNITFVKSFKNILEASYDISSSTLTFVSSQKIDKIDLKIDSAELFYINTDLLDSSQGVYTYKAIINNLAVSKLSNMTVSPSSYGYNVFNGTATTVTII